MFAFKGLREVPVKDVKFGEGFWKEKYKLLKETIMPYQLELAHSTGSIANYKIAAGLSLDDYKSNFPFQISIVDLGKLLETAGYLLQHESNPELEVKWIQLSTICTWPKWQTVI